MDPDPLTELEMVSKEIEEATEDIYFFMSTTNTLTAERAKLQATIKKRRKEDKPDKTGLRIFETEAFVVAREPVEIAREMYAAVTMVPPKWTPSGTEAKMKELVAAYEEKVKRAPSKTDRVNLLNEYFKAKSWLEKFSAAVNQPDGVARSRLYDILNNGLVRGKWKEKMEEAMETVKKDYESLWKEKVFAKGLAPKTDGGKAGGAKQNTTMVTTANTAGAKKFRFSKLTEYRAAGVFMREAAFPRPKNLPPHLKHWCGKCCWSDHVTKDCPQLNGSGGQGGQQHQLPPPPQGPQQGNGFQGQQSQQYQNGYF